MRVVVASDWHLGPESPPLHARLAAALLARARDEGATVVLAGDVFEELFSGPGRAEAAHPEVAGAIAALARAGRLHRLAGNHDPDAGPARLVLDVPGTGRVLVEHGHAADPVHASAVGRLGDAVSRRLGRLGAVRGAARLAERAARAALGPRLAAQFRRRCLARVAEEGADLGVFGHVHVAHAEPGDRYANAGAMGEGSLTCAVLDRAGVHLEVLRADGRWSLQGTAEGGETKPPGMG